MSRIEITSHRSDESAPCFGALEHPPNNQGRGLTYYRGCQLCPQGDFTHQPAVQRAEASSCSCALEFLKHTLETFKRKVSSHDKFSSLLADKGYDASHCRTVCQQHKLMPCIPRRRTKDIFPGRYVVEQTFGLLDQFRRVRVRYETLSRNFKSMHFLALSVIVARRLT